MKIIKATELILITQIKALLFGQPGAGKSSLALTAEKPLLLDFDKGAHRALIRADSLEINTWADVVELMNSPKEDLAEYKTLVLDTAGKALDMLAQFIIQENGKLATAGGALTLQGYGVRRVYFKSFLDKAATLGLDIVLVAHDKEEKVDDVTKVRPDVGGSSYGDILKDVDLCGYVEIIKGKRTVNFNPSERSIGKNCAGFPEMDLTKIDMKQLIDSAKKTLNERNQGNLEVLEEITEIKAKIANINTVEDANLFLAGMGDITTDVVKQQVRKAMAEKTTALGLVFDGKNGQGTNQYVLKADYKPATQPA